MEVKKGYKQTEVGVIPEDWKVKKLVEFVKIASGESPSRFKFTDDGTPYFKVEQLNNGNKYLIDTPYHSKFKTTVSKGSIIFPKRGASILLNKVRILSEDSFMDTNLMTLTVSDEINNEFFYYALLHKELWRIADTTSIPQINNKHINPFLIPLPPTKAEQTAIATALSDADTLIQSLEKLIAKKRFIKQGAVQELLKPNEGWVVKKLGEIFSFSGGYSASREQLSNDGFCYLHYGDIHGSRKTFIDIKKNYTEIPKLNIPLNKVSPKSLLYEGDIVFVDASEDDEGTSKHIVVKNPDGVPYISGLHTIIAKSKDDSLNDDYKRYCFQSAYIKSQFKFYAVGTKVSGISKTNIAKIELSFPVLSEQIRIAVTLSDMDAEIFALESKLVKYKQIKQGMMQELLTGRIRLV